MGVPKGKTSRNKRDSRRSHIHATANAAVKCKNCGNLKQAHVVCPSCGFYNDTQVIAKEEI